MRERIAAERAAINESGARSLVSDAGERVTGATQQLVANKSHGIGHWYLGTQSQADIRLDQIFWAVPYRMPFLRPLPFGQSEPAKAEEPKLLESILGHPLPVK